MGPTVLHSSGCLPERPSLVPEWRRLGLKSARPVLRPGSARKIKPWGDPLRGGLGIAWRSQIPPHPSPINTAARSICETGGENALPLGLLSQSAAMGTVIENG